jgi:hypothetical protein
MPTPKAVRKDFENEKFAIEFDSYADLEVAAKILEEWDQFLENLREGGKELELNGQALAEFGGWGRVEGRLRVLIGGALQENAEVLALKARTDTSSAILFEAERIILQIQDRLLREQPEDFLAWIEDCPPINHSELRTRFQEELRQDQERLAELNREGSPLL